MLYEVITEAGRGRRDSRDAASGRADPRAALGILFDSPRCVEHLDLIDIDTDERPSYNFV